MEEHFVDYPFCRTEVTLHDDEGGPYVVKSWRPGVDLDPGDGNFDRGWAEKMGQMVLIEVDSHKLPKPYQERVFYLREWIDPDGKRFGKRTLRIITRRSFTSMFKGYRHEFDLEYPQELPQ